MGRVLAPYGVKGWVRIEPYSEDPGSLANQRIWWLRKSGDWRKVEVLESVLQHGAKLVARLAGCVERDAALALKGSEVALERSVLQPNAENEFYWVDLVGLKVVNGKGEELGVVAEIFENGAHAVMRVVDGESERLLPFAGQVVQEVDRALGLIRVEWGLDW